MSHPTRAPALAKENTLFFRPGNPLLTNFQFVTCEKFADTLRRVTIRKEKPDVFAAAKGKWFTFNFNAARSAKMETGHVPFQSESALFQRKLQITIPPFDSVVEHKRHQPVAG